MKDDELLPQAYALGHDSKFVRPGYVRVEAAPKPEPGVSTSAFFDPESHRTVLVLVNEKAASTADLLAFRQRIVDAVRTKFGIQLEQALASRQQAARVPAVVFVVLPRRRMLEDLVDGAASLGRAEDKRGPIDDKSCSERTK